MRKLTVRRRSLLANDTRGILADRGAVALGLRKGMGLPFPIVFSDDAGYTVG